MHPALLATIALFVSTLCYASRCYLSPFGSCRKCQGKRRRGPRHCRRCDSTGLRLRVGRRLWNYVRHLHHDGR
ncbi:hypothetical protein [Nonomuraea antri]|uniref:hypothetical protein n=1 Tax=Nonomuraea antri TaxID=2730852 RepID=UPI00156885B3|nr:hypothetical protein [Nonomuraea antri]